MTTLKPTLRFPEFKTIYSLIKDAQNRTYSKVNIELILLYYHVGAIVSEKVTSGIWGQKIVDELALFIHSKLPTLSGFNRRGLYRMKQFYETYSDNAIVSPVVTQFGINPNEADELVNNRLGQLDFRTITI